jgi:GT2 family glycosyltransferase
VAFTDADCRPARDWLRAAVRALQEDPPADVVGGAVELVYDSGRPAGGAEWYEHLHGFPQEDYVRRGFAVTANLVTRRSVLERVGPFDASLASGGDAEWGRRVTSAGGILRYAADARVSHPARATREALIRKGRRTTRGVATKALRLPGGRRTVLRMLGGHARDLVVVSATTWVAPAPTTLREKAAYVRIRWAVGLAVQAELVRCLRRSPS